VLQSSHPIYRFMSLLTGGDPFLTGTIPTQIGMLTKLSSIAVSEYILFSLSLLECKILTTYHFISLLSTEDNALTGTIPSELGLLSNAEQPFEFLNLGEYILDLLSVLFYKMLTQNITSFCFSGQLTISSPAPFLPNSECGRNCQLLLWVRLFWFPYPCCTTKFLPNVSCHFASPGRRQFPHWYHSKRTRIA
jgi:hypothetical protein